MSESRLNIAVLGAGRIGSLHARHLATRIGRARPIVVADIAEGSARQVADECGIAHVTTSPEEAIARADVDAVMICTSTDTHADLVVAAADAGKHIFCEKPIDHSLGKIDRALAAVAAAGVKMQVGFNRRFDANYARLRRAVVSGEIGDPFLLHIISRDPAPPPVEYVRVSGGIFLDMTIHDFDMARFLIGAEVVEIYTNAGVRVDPAIGEAGDLDTAHIALRFENGVIGTIDNCRQAVYGYDQRAEILGSRGAAASDNEYPNRVTVAGAEKIQRDLPLNFFMDRYTESFVTEVQAFVDAVLDGRDTPVGGVDGRVPVVMGLAARKSYDEHRPVRLDEITP